MNHMTDAEAADLKEQDKLAKREAARLRVILDRMRTVRGFVDPHHKHANKMAKEAVDQMEDLIKELELWQGSIRQQFVVRPPRIPSDSGHDENLVAV